MKRTFDSFHPTPDGFITQHELRAALESAGEKVTEQQVGREGEGGGGKGGGEEERGRGRGGEGKRRSKELRRDGLRRGVDRRS